MGRSAHPTDPALLSDPKKPFVHRDLSWLFFNERVLTEARDQTNPLLERVKFLAISASNLDEFFMIRFLSVARNIERAQGKDPVTHKRFSKIRQSMLLEISEFTQAQEAVLLELKNSLEESGFRIVLLNHHANAASAEDLEIAKSVLAQDVLSKLPPPEAYSAGFLPKIENLQLCLLLGESPNAQWVCVPQNIPLVHTHTHPETGVVRYFFLDDLLLWGLPQALQVSGACSLFRITRDGDVSIEFSSKDSASIPDVVISGLKRRDAGKIVRLQVLTSQSGKKVHNPTLAQALKLSEDQIFYQTTTLVLHSLWSVVHQSAKHLELNNRTTENMLYKPLLGYIPPALGPDHSDNIFNVLKQRDILLHHPYDSFEGYVSFIKTACQDPSVLSIEQTVYRMDAISPLIDALKEAAARKKIRVAIELRARFDEYNNLKLAEDLRQCGAEVHFGFGKLKLHAKIALITRIENGAERHYTHISTGNYKAATARQYTDIGIITSHAGIGADARKFFDGIKQENIPAKFEYIVHAPARLHRRLIAHIKAETEAGKAGKPARIFAKMNALVDEGVVEHLYLASQAGVKIDLVVRGACSLVPGIKGLSENITVRSIIDRFLEHSRIYYFESSGTVYLSSADWMPRNFFSRLELAFPVLSTRLHHYIRDVIIPTYLADNVKAWILNADGHWTRSSASSEPQHRAQFIFEALAAKAYEGTVLHTHYGSDAPEPQEVMTTHLLLSE